jgi:hypothetical protein
MVIELPQKKKPYKGEQEMTRRKEASRDVRKPVAMSQAEHPDSSCLRHTARKTNS